MTEKESVLQDCITSIMTLSVADQQVVVSDLYNYFYQHCRKTHIEAEQRVASVKTVLSSYPYKPPLSEHAGAIVIDSEIKRENTDDIQG